MSDDSWGSGGESEEDGAAPNRQNKFKQQLQANVKDLNDAPCTSCKKTVIISQQLRIEGSIFHKNCFKCLHCGNKLSAGNYAAMNNKYYCKPHYKQLFQSKGNYAEGFGEEDPKAKWQNKS